MRDLIELLNRLQGKGVKVSLVFERDGVHHQAKFERSQKRLTIGSPLNWGYWSGIINTRDALRNTIDVAGGKLTVYVEGVRNDDWLYTMPPAGE